jgi:hypothetical protein
MRIVHSSDESFRRCGRLLRRQTKKILRLVWPIPIPNEGRHNLLSGSVLARELRVRREGSKGVMLSNQQIGDSSPCRRQEPAFLRPRRCDEARNVCAEPDQR